MEAFREAQRKQGDLSFIIDKKSGKSIRMKRERNVWMIDTYVDLNEPANEDLDFARPE